MKNISDVFRVVSILLLLIIGIISSKMFLYTSSLWYGCMASLCSILIGAYSLACGIDEYQKEDNRDEPICSNALNIIRAVALIFVGVMYSILMILRWKQ